MIAIDTNILVRYLTQDDAAQSPLATALIEGRLSADSPGFISIPVICEMAWVLTSLYGRSHRDLIEILEKLIDSAQLMIDEADILRAAMASPHMDLSDAIIHALGRARGCERTLTFDRNFSRLPQVEYLTAWRAS
jgi:predicted nucleic-acid-binding protein